MAASGPEQREPIPGIEVHPLSDRSSVVKKTLNSLMAAEVDRWKAAAPEVVEFEGDNYKRWYRFAQSTCREGFQKLGIPVDEKWSDTFAPMNHLSIQYAIVLTQESYPFYGMPESMALATALNLDIAVEIDEFASYGDFDRDIRQNVARNSQLVGWLLENHRRIQSPSIVTDQGR